MLANATGVVKEFNHILKIDGSFYISDLTSRARNMKKFINSIEKLGLSKI